MTTTAAQEPLTATSVAPDTRSEHINTPPDTNVDTELTIVSAPPRSAVQVTTVAAVSVVAAVAAVVSFMHMHELAARAGEGWRAWLLPLAIDGLVVAASMTMVIRRRAGKKTGWLAWTSITLGIAASLAANIAAAEPTLIGRAVAAWPPIALLLAYELLMDQIHIATKHTSTQHFAHLPMPTTAAPANKPTAANDLAAVPSTPATATAPSAAPTPNGTAPVDGIPNSQTAATVATAPAVSAVLMAVPDQDQNSSAAVRHAARQRYLKTLTDGLPCTGRELADMYGMSERWGRYQIRATRRAITTVHATQDAADSPLGA